jgi:cytochrome P450
MTPTHRGTYPLTDPDVLAEPYALYRRMRREDPVHWSDALGAWVLTRHADVQAAVRDPRLGGRPNGGPVRRRPRAPEPAAGETERAEDAQVSQRLRALAGRVFAPGVVDQAGPLVGRVVDGLLDQVQGRGRMDVVTDLARPLPAIVFAELLGVPAEDRAAFQRWSEDAARYLDVAPGDPEEAAQTAGEATARLEDYFEGLLCERRQRPGDDLVGLFLADRQDPALAAEEVCAQCTMLLAAGLRTTTDQLANAVSALLAHPEQMEQLRADPTLTPFAVDEALRYDGAVTFLQRIAREDLEVGGRTIHAGRRVYLGIAAANRDPEAFAEPDRFDVRRGGSRHLAFGGGAHFCLGAGLARRALEVALQVLARRLPRLRPDPDRPARRRCGGLTFRGFASLPARLS